MAAKKAIGLAGLLLAAFSIKPATKQTGAQLHVVRKSKPANPGLQDRIQAVFGDRLFNFGNRGEPGQVDRGNVTKASYSPQPGQPANTNRKPSGGAGVGALLNLIGSAEAPKGYDQIWGGINLADYPPKPITQMTIGQVLAWQDSIDRKYQSEAAGRYQILEDTLRRIYRRAGLTTSDLFSPANQDKLAVVLMTDAGLDRYRSGAWTAEKFADRLARVWAGLPVQSDQPGHKVNVRRGQSYYARDGLNKATVKPEAVLAAVRRV